MNGLRAVGRIATWAFAIGVVCFSVGFFGPMIFAPGANQGPLLGILITGPLGFLGGLGVGVLREILGYRAGPLEMLARTGIGDLDYAALLRPAAGLAGLILAGYGVIGLQRGEGRGAAAAIVVAAALAYFAVTGQAPAWFRR
jgi:hypothetical protein